MDMDLAETTTLRYVDWESMESDGEERTGLGITFYDHQGNGRRSSLYRKRQSSDRKLKPPKLRQTNVASPSSIRSDVTHNKPLSYTLLDDLLEQNYRDQAETYSRCFNCSWLAPDSPRSETILSDFSPAPLKCPRLLNKTRSPLFAESQGLYLPSANPPSELKYEQINPNCSYSQASGFTPVKPPSRPREHPSIIHTPHKYLAFSAPSPSSSQIKPVHCVPEKGQEYFLSSNHKRHRVSELVDAKRCLCQHQADCVYYFYLESKNHRKEAMPTPISPEERQKIINSNRSLRIIKNELESLAEHGVISDEVYDSIMTSLPAELSLNAASTRKMVKYDNTNPSPTPAPAPAPVREDTPTNAMENLNLNRDQPSPSYNIPTPPSLPNRAQSSPPTRPEVTRATVLYRYSQPGDCNFEVGDQIAVYEYMNLDWWFGKNLRTGQEGVFPQSYVRVIQHPAQGVYGNEKADITTRYPGQYQQQVSPYSTTYYNPAPPIQPSNPYNSAVPPMQVADQPTESKMGKGGEMGKKFGKKLGNAAIFGAGATIGGNIVNSIF